MIGLSQEYIYQVIEMYSRTENVSGAISSRCLYCFSTVVSEVETTKELDSVEKRHICPEKALAQLLAREQWSGLQPPRPMKV